MLYAVIPAGGSGTRLWPLSRACHPKFLHPLTPTGESLLQATIARLDPLAGPARTLVVTGAAHAVGVARELPQLPTGNIIVEPSPRDSCAAIGLAAALIHQQDPDAVMGSFAADHVIGDNARFAQVVTDAVAGAQAGYLMTIGITPTRPETGYGYLHLGAAVAGGPVRQVAEFKEKPEYEVAVGYVDSGAYLWNAGMFVWKVSVFLDELRRQCPELAAGLATIAAAWDTPQRESVLAEVWPTLPKISVDYAVMEGAAAAGRVAAVPGDFGWNDIGDFHTLGEVLPVDDHGNTVLTSGRVLLDDCTDSVVVGRTDRLVAVLGVQDLVIVDTADALLVAPRARAQEVKRLVDTLKGRGDGDLV